MYKHISDVKVRLKKAKGYKKNGQNQLEQEGTER